MEPVLHVWALVLDVNDGAMSVDDRVWLLCGGVQLIFSDRVQLGQLSISLDTTHSLTFTFTLPQAMH